MPASSPAAAACRHAPGPAAGALELGALCDIDPEKEKMCKEKYPEFPFFKDWKEMVDSGKVGRRRHDGAALSAP